MLWKLIALLMIKHVEMLRRQRRSSRIAPCVSCGCQKNTCSMGSGLFLGGALFEVDDFSERCSCAWWNNKRTRWRHTSFNCCGCCEASATSHVESKRRGKVAPTFERQRSSTWVNAFFQCSFSYSTNPSLHVNDMGWIHESRRLPRGEDLKKLTWE